MTIMWHFGIDATWHLGYPGERHSKRWRRAVDAAQRHRDELGMSDRDVLAALDAYDERWEAIQRTAVAAAMCDGAYLCVYEDSAVAFACLVARGSSRRISPEQYAAFCVREGVEIEPWGRVEAVVRACCHDAAALLPCNPAARADG